jgi:hypothetical protein
MNFDSNGDGFSYSILTHTLTTVLETYFMLSLSMYTDAPKVLFFPRNSQSAPSAVADRNNNPTAININIRLVAISPFLWIITGDYSKKERNLSTIK